MTTDVPFLLFVDPSEIDQTFRVCLWAAAGSGKSCAAASAPDPIVVLSADRPSAYRFARKLHADKVIREMRYVNSSSLNAIYSYLKDPETDARTVVLDPISNIYDALTEELPPRPDGEPNYQAVNKKILGFVKSLRALDVNVVLVAHEKISDGNRGDGKIYPSLGGPALINKLLMEMDIVAHIERHVSQSGDDERVQYIGRLQPSAGLVCKDGTDALGERRVADLTRWFELANKALAPDVPWEGPTELPPLERPIDAEAEAVEAFVEATDVPDPQEAAEA